MRITAILVWTVLCLASGSALFTIAFAVEDLEEELTAINRQIEEEREAVHVLEAEWSYLTRPARIGELGTQLLPELVNASIDQIVSLDDVPLPFEEPAQPRPPRVHIPAPNNEPSFETLVRDSLTSVRSTQ